jgi:hypothetical protein
MKFILIIQQWLKEGFIILPIFFSLMVYGQEKDTDQEEYLKIGGALRVNLVNENYEASPQPTSTYATLDMWRVNVDALYSGIRMDFEYRFYPTFNTHFIHHGYFGYNFSENINMQLGITRVPFGNLAYNSHNWWFLLPYYVGLEDDYDMGIKLIWANPSFDLRAAYFRQSAPAGPSYGKASFGGPAAGTYSYNVIPDEEGVLSPTGAESSIRELNQFNIRAAWKITEGAELGFSGQIKGLHNLNLQQTDYGNAWAMHLNTDFYNFNLKLQFTSYDYNARDDDGNLLTRVQMGAYGDPYYDDGVAAEADLITAAIAYSIPVKWGPVSNVLPYFNYSVMMKSDEYNFEGQSYDFSNSIMVVPGIMLTAGKIYTYIDFAMGKNHPWLTDSFGTGLGYGRLYSNDPNDRYYDPQKNGQPVPVNQLKWNWRFNVNMGYYF